MNLITACISVHFTDERLSFTQFLAILKNAAIMNVFVYVFWLTSVRLPGVELMGLGVCIIFNFRGYCQVLF